MARSSYALTLVFAALLLAAAGWTYKELLWSVFGSLDRDGAPAVRAFDDGGRVALLVSGHTLEANALRGDRGLDPAWLAANLDTWRAFLRSAGATVEEVSDDDVASGRLAGFDLLVLPSTSALSDAQIDAIKAYLHGGGGLLATWTPGVYRPDGSWRGWTFIEETFGVEAAGFLERAHSNFRVYTDTFPGIAQPGLYLPLPAGDDASSPRQASRGGAAGSPFPPLSGFRWEAPLTADRPADHFALADTLVRYRQRGDELVPEPATRVQFFTWQGGDVSAAAEAARAEASFGRVTFAAGTPLAAGIPTAFRMKTGTFDAPLQLRAVEPRTRVAAFWHDFAASDRPAADALPASGAAVYGSYGAGRFVYLGHELSAMGYDPVEQGVLAQVFENTLRWLGHAPLAWVEPWPAQHRGAALVAGVAEDDPLALEAMLGPFREAGARATFFLSAHAAAGYPDLMARLAERAELGLLAEPGLPAGALRELRDRFAGGAGRPPAGLRAARRGALSDAAAEAMRHAGFAYALPDTLGRAQQAELRAGDRLVAIPRTARTDRDLLARTPAASHDARLALIADDLLRAEAEGGLYTLIVHDDAFGLPEHLPLLRESLAMLRQRGFWMPTAGELAKWTRARHGLGVRVEARGPRRINVRVSNGGDVTAENVAVTVALGGPAGEIAIRPELVGTPRPEYALSEDASRLTLFVDRLAPGQYRVYQVDLTPPAPEAPLAAL
jgi:peptidoglycan/xylan/chitin deacetylase (PgdA/CDA1 family)